MPTTPTPSDAARKRHEDDLLDDALEGSFPASDPPSRSEPALPEPKPDGSPEPD
jgi:hypothetical protein